MKRYKHNLSNYKLATMDMGKLVPVQCLEVLPGDTIQLDTSALIRVSPMLAPVMHPVTVRFHHWFVPNRILWDKWEDFITGGNDGRNADTIPTLQPGTSTADTLSDYFGIPPGVADNPTPSKPLEVNALPYRAYNMIYNNFYRDEDLQTERSEDDTSLASPCWRKDYFTSARPWPQKGPDINIPIGTTAPVTGSINIDSFGDRRFTLKTDEPVTQTPANLEAQMHQASEVGQRVFTTGSRTHGPLHWADPKLKATHSLVADLSDATGVSVTQFREFFALQRYEEARARYGSRYTEYLRYLGVTPSDGRLQLPEYLGGGKQNLQFSEILQTGADGNNPVGTLRGHGISALKTRPTRRFFEEHGFVMTLMSVVPRSIYQDGMPRFFLKTIKEDIFQKELQSIGQQEIWQGEVSAIFGGDQRETFGYSDRYAEYSSSVSGVCGEFRNTLDFWHLARKFATKPALNSDFVTCNPSKRIFASQNTHSLWCMINNKVIARRICKKVSVGRLL